MTVKEILKEYHNGTIDYLRQQGKLDAETVRKIDVLEQIFTDSKLTDYILDYVKIVRMYYKDNVKMNVCAEAVNTSERNAYRMRNACVDWLSELLDKPPHSDKEST